VGDGGVSGPEDDSLASWVAEEGIDRLLYLGDVYESGTAEEFETNYASSWGRFRRLTSPTPGNHEWGRREEGYDRYWGRRALGARGAHYYSFNLDGWHFVSLNSEEDTDASSPQVAWLRRDLSRYRVRSPHREHVAPRLEAPACGEAQLPCTPVAQSERPARPA
jgi:hypothetical protein